MNKNFWAGVLFGMLIVIVGLAVFGRQTTAPTTNSPEQKERQGEKTASTTETNTIWNEFDGEIGI